MTNVSAIAAASLATALNNGVPATFTPTETVDRLSALEASASDMAKAIGVAENAIGESAKAWGCNFLNLAKLHGLDGDTLAERCRTALGWADLRGDAGSKVKTRFNTWRSNIGKVSGVFDTLDETVRNELLGGTRSFITVYKDILTAEKEAKRKADAEKAAAEKALADIANGVANDAAPTKAEPETFDVLDAIETLTLVMDDMSASDMEAIQVAFAAMVNAYDKRVTILTANEALAA